MIDLQMSSLWLQDPFVQSGILPLLVGLAVAAGLGPLRLGGLAAGAGFVAAVWAIGNFGWEPMTSTRKLVVVGAAAAGLGAALDLARVVPGWLLRVALAALAGAGAVWMLWSILSQRPVSEAVLLGAGAFVVLAWLAGASLAASADRLQAGATALALGLASGAAAVLGGSVLLGQYGVALGASCGAFLLMAVLRRDAVMAASSLHASLTLGASVIGGVILVGSAMMAQLPWYSIAVLALVPLPSLLPLTLPRNPWLRATAATLYACIPAVLGCATAWWSTRGGAA